MHRDRAEARRRCAGRRRSCPVAVPDSMLSDPMTSPACARLSTAADIARSTPRPRGSPTARPAPTPRKAASRPSSRWSRWSRQAQPSRPARFVRRPEAAASARIFSTGSSPSAASSRSSVAAPVDCTLQQIDGSTRFANVAKNPRTRSVLSASRVFSSSTVSASVTAVSSGANRSCASRRPGAPVQNPARQARRSAPDERSFRDSSTLHREERESCRE